MASNWKTARVFISSTFRDMHAERDHLVKVVFPALRERLAKHQIHLIDIDLRWGITEEESQKNRVLDICLQLIEECRPFFVGILAERYGWVADKVSLEARAKLGSLATQAGKSVTELEILHGVLATQGMRDHAVFLFRDPALVLQVPDAKRGEVAAESPESAKKLKELKQSIRDAQLPIPPLENYPCQFTGLRVPWRIVEPELTAADKGQFEVLSRNNLVTPEIYAQLNPRWRELVDRHGSVYVSGLELFGRHIQDRLWEAISREFQLGEMPTIAAPAQEQEVAEAAYHDAFIESRLRVFVGRLDVLDRLHDYATGKDRRCCLVEAESGSGKSALLAKLVTEYRQRYPQHLVVPHFVGASPTSTELRPLLRRLCSALQERFEFSETVLGADGQSHEIPFVIPEQMTELKDTFRIMLESVPEQGCVLFVLDALDQLDRTDGAAALHWLPEELPAGVKIVASSIGQADEDLKLALACRRWHRVPLPLLSDDERLAILREVPSLSAKTLDDQQLQLLLDNPATRNPLFLQVALEELRGFGSHEQLSARIRALPQTGDTITSMFVQVIERLGQDFDRNLARAMVALLAAARRGLSEQELTELAKLAGPTDDFYPILRQLRPYLLLRGGLLGFFHRGLQRAADATLLRSARTRAQVHRALARYFARQATWKESIAEQRRHARSAPPRPRLVNFRKADELLWHWIRSGDGDAVVEAFTDWQLLEAKAEGGLSFDLAVELRGAAAVLPADHPGHRILRLLAEAVQSDIHVLARHPTMLFSCLWNSCWWYDAPSAAAHYEPPEAGEVAPWDFPGPKLHQIMEAWREAKEAHTPGFLWVRSLRPPHTHLGAAQQAVLRGHTEAVASVAYSPDGLRLVSASADLTTRVWDVETGRERLAVPGPKLERADFSADGRFVLGHAAGQAMALVWDANTGQPAPTRDLAVPAESSGEAVSPDGRLLLTFKQKATRSGGADGTIQTEFEPVRLIERASGRELCQLPGHELPVSCGVFSPDGRLAATGSYDRTVRVWDTATGQVRRVFHGHLAVVTDVAFSPDGRQLASAGGTRYGVKDCSIRLWSLASGSESRRLRNHRYLVTCLALSADGTLAVSGSQNNDPIKTWELAYGTLLCERFEHEGWVNDVVLSEDGSFVAAASGEDVGVWDARTGRRRFLLRQHTAPHHSPARRVCFHPDGKVVLSEHREDFVDDVVRVWDAQSGDCLELHRGKLEDTIGPVAAPLWGARASDRLETAIVDTVARRTVAWFPAELSHAVVHADQPVMLGAANNHVYLLQLEGCWPEHFEPGRDDAVDLLPAATAAPESDQERRVANVEQFSGDETAKLIDKLIEGKEIKMDFIGDIVSSVLAGLGNPMQQQGRLKKDDDKPK